MFEIQVPDDWVGKSIGTLDIRKKHKVNVIGIKEGGKVRLTISPDTVLEAGETIDVYKRQALAQADVGLAMNSGTQAAKEAARCV